ncbi:SCO-spondin, partial [Trichoplax sp. H2]
PTTTPTPTPSTSKPTTTPTPSTSKPTTTPTPTPSTSKPTTTPTPSPSTSKPTTTPTPTPSTSKPTTTPTPTPSTSKPTTTPTPTPSTSKPTTTPTSTPSTSKPTTTPTPTPSTSKPTTTPTPTPSTSKPTTTPTPSTSKPTTTPTPTPSTSKPTTTPTPTPSTSKPTTTPTPTPSTSKPTTTPTPTPSTSKPTTTPTPTPSTSKPTTTPTPTPSTSKPTTSPTPSTSKPTTTPSTSKPTTTPTPTPSTSKPTTSPTPTTITWHWNISTQTTAPYTQPVSVIPSSTKPPSSYCDCPCVLRNITSLALSLNATIINKEHPHCTVFKFDCNECRCCDCEFRCTNKTCPRDGGWSKWTTWSPCNATCGGGFRYRSRTCTNPSPKGDGKACEGSSREFEDCGMNACVVDCGWSSWSFWTSCSASCGGGISTRHREPVWPSGNIKKNECNDHRIETKYCNAQPCPGGCKSGSVNLNCAPSNTFTCEDLQNSNLNSIVSNCSTGCYCPNGYVLHNGSCTPVANCPCSYKGNKYPAGSRIFKDDKCNYCDCIDGKLSCTNNVCTTGPHWSEWSHWGMCNATCGLGIEKRYRTCTYPVQQSNIGCCDGPSVMTRDCFRHACPQNGQWGEWSLWSNCSECCDGGVKTRHRLCNNPPSANGGEPCKGSHTERMHCQSAPCNQRCDVYGRSLIRTSCPNQCPRTCEDLAVGTNCVEGLAECGCKCPGSQVLQDKVCVERSECKCSYASLPSDVHYNSSALQGKANPGAIVSSGCNTCVCNSGKWQCTPLPCPVDGNWTRWTDWGVCSVTCGTGIRRRYRTCENPQPKNGGKICGGHSVETGVCKMAECPGSSTDTCYRGTGSNYRGTVSVTISGRLCALWKTESSSSQCSGIGNHNYCRNPDNSPTGPWCYTTDPLVPRERCNISTCIDGNWGSWMPWSECSKPCGGGSQRRARFCNNPAPSTNGIDCKGSSLETKTCNDKICSSEMCSVWSHWSGWSSCSKTCGTGERRKYRMCLDPLHYNIQNDSLVDYCNTNCCPEGIWDTWSEWSTCSVTCGGGIRERKRNCNSVPGGCEIASCTGEATDWESCNSQNCSSCTGGMVYSNCGTPCPATCSNPEVFCAPECTPGCRCPAGQVVQNGICVHITKCACYANNSGVITTIDADKSALINGKNCICQNGRLSCPVNGGWSLWSAWSKCSETCGVNAKKIRYRYCNNPKPQDNGEGCLGPNHEIQNCPLTNCPVDGAWSSWTSWSTCSKPCGGGYQSRMRTCDNPAPKYGGKVCLETSVSGKIERRSCNSARCLEPCIASGKLESDCANSCYSTCDDIREGVVCKNSSCVKGCRSCMPGLLYQDGQCVKQSACKCQFSIGSHPDIPVNNVHIVYDSTSRSVSYLTSHLFQPGAAVSVGCHTCTCVNGKFSCSAQCQTNGGWSDWSKWSSCSVTCGSGINTRVRSCTNPAPAANGNDCIGNAIETKSCSLDACPVDCKWSQWSAWSNCSHPCNGLEYRKRDKTEPINDGKKCTAASYQKRSCISNILCNNQICEGGAALVLCKDSFVLTCDDLNPNVQGIKRCTEKYVCKCPDGMVFQDGTCIQSSQCKCLYNKTELNQFNKMEQLPHYAAMNGQNLLSDVQPLMPGSFVDTNCNNCTCISGRIDCVPNGKCSISGGWSSWSLWSQCSKTCGDGEQSRTRTCNNPLPQNGGKSCEGSNIEKRKCNAATCSCGNNMEYRTCGIACQPTCENQHEPLMCQQNCTSGCFCKPGYVLDIDKCVLPKNCPCYMDNIRYENNQKFRDRQDNNLLCTCYGGHYKCISTCKNLHCKPGEIEVAPANSSNSCPQFCAEQPKTVQICDVKNKTAFISYKYNATGGEISCESLDRITYNYCEGVCASTTSIQPVFPYEVTNCKCCKSKSMRTQIVSFYCQDGSRIEKEIGYPTACSCLECNHANH